MKKGLIFICLLLLLFMCGCSKKEIEIDESIKEYGDFYYKVYNKGENKEEYIIILGLSETGKKKEAIVIPETIDGIQVEKIGENGKAYDGCSFYSTVLKRVYIPFSDCEIRSFGYGFPKNTKIFKLTSSFPGITCYVTSYWYNENENRLSSNDVILKGNLPYISLFYKIVHYYYANVSYMYNYDTDLNHGYYWIDDYEYGTKILYKPDDPEREGYTFGGWYKESECINKWDFDNDTLPEYTGDIEGYKEALSRNEMYTEKYVETKLYAKWIEME